MYAKTQDLEHEARSMNAGAGQHSYIDRLRTEYGEPLSILGLAALGIAAIYTYATDYSFLTSKLSEAPIEHSLAETISVSNSVRHKSNGGLIWTEAGRNRSLMSGDQLFTDKGAAAEILFADGGHILLGENSLIQIEERNDEATINLIEGELLNASFAERDVEKKVVLRLGETKIKLSEQSSFRAKISEDGGANLVMTQGSAEIEGSVREGSTPIMESQSIDISKDGSALEVKTLPFAMIEPAPAAAFDIEDSLAITFSWSKRKLDVPVLLEISRDSSFNRPDYRKLLRGHRYELTLHQPGTYFWRVGEPESVDKVNYFESSRSFRLDRVGPPTALWPPHLYAADSVRGQRTNLTFSWQPEGAKLPSDQGAVRLVCARDAAFKKVVVDKVIERETTLSASFSEGEFHWRIASLLPNGRMSAWSETRIFAIRAAAKNEAFTNTLPQQDGLEADSSQFQLSAKSPLNTDDALSLRAEDSAARPQSPKKPATSIAAVKVKLKGKIRSPRSPFQPLLQPQLAYRSSTALIDFGPGVKVQFSWPKVERAASYELEISKDREFQRLQDSAILPASSLTAEKLLTGGAHHVRLRAVDGQHQAGPWSPPIQVPLVAWAPLPAPDFQLNAERFLFRNNAPQVQAIIRDQSAEASAFELQVAKRSDFASLIYQKSIESRLAGRTIALPAMSTDHVIRLRAIDRFSKPGVWSEARAVSVRKVDGEPQLVSPAADANIAFGYLDRKLIEFRWKDAPDANESELLVATDQDFKTIVAREKTADESIRLALEQEGRLYWQVRQTSKPEAIELRSNIHTLTTKILPLPPVDRSKAPHEAHVGLGVGILDYSFENDDAKNKVDASMTQALFLSYAYWLDDAWGLEGKLTGNTLFITGEEKEQNKLLKFLDMSLLIRYLHELSKQQGFRLEGLLGFSGNTLARVVALESGVDVKEYQPLHAWMGAGFLYALTSTLFLNPRIEYGHPLYLEKAEIKRGTYLRGFLRALHRVPSWGANLSYGLLGESKQYRIAKSGVEEKIQSNLKSLLLGIGKDF